MRTLTVMLVVFGAVTALGQTKPRPVVDAGVPDAGVAAPQACPACPTCAAPKPDPQVELLRKDVAELKAMLEKHASQNETTAAAVQRIEKQVASLRSDVADAEARKTEEQRVTAERRAQTSQANASLAWAEQQLSSGSNNVGDALRAAEQVYTGSALRAVQSARAALANGDLAAARTWLAIAVAEAANPRD